MSIELDEDSLEKKTSKLFQDLGYDTLDCMYESFGENSTLGRENTSEVVLVSKLRESLIRLNPTLSNDPVELAIEELVKDRSSLSMVNANKEIYKFLKEGVKVTFKDVNGFDTEEVVKVIDWDNLEGNNDFFLVSQFWITGEIYKRRADLIGFINGLPLIFIELKASHKRIENAFNDNMRDYKYTIPQVFWYNAFIIVSNGSESKIGSISSEWEHFSEWKKINNEGEEGVISLDTLIRGTCDQTKLLDLVENFTQFRESTGGLIKIIAKNHQYLGVNQAFERIKIRKELLGKLGVFWHTQGSGKSFSMVFFSQKVFRKLQGNWTFLIVTDREDLDTQIYKNFAYVGAVTEEEVRANSREHLKQLLQEDHRNIFTMIQKFGTNTKGEDFPELSTRDDLIIITDEAHRSQYDILASNMRIALPNASFIAFTGTPLIAGEEKTKEVFGDYVSVYNFKQSVEDKATVPLYYENRIPELQIINENLGEDLQMVIEEADLGDKEEELFARKFVNVYQLITRDGRLERIAKDIVDHFMERGFMGKAMVISIDKATAVKMYDKVNNYWEKYIKKLKLERNITSSKEIKDLITNKIKYMEETDIAVIVSQGQNEEEDLKAKGVDIRPHRIRMNKERMDEKFKDPEDKLRIVFVCAMWVTGFDAPSVSTIYLDKPLKNHTLMQTIARANRVFKDKCNGLIVDYIGIFNSLQKALAIYGGSTITQAGKIDTPVQDKEELVRFLENTIEEARYFCKEKQIDLYEIINEKDTFIKIKLLDNAVEAILETEETKKKFTSLAKLIIRLFKAILPDVSAQKFFKIKVILSLLLEKIANITNEPVDNSAIEALSERVEDLLNDSITAKDYTIKDSKIFDLSQLDFEALQSRFINNNKKKTEIEKLKSSINSKITNLLMLNKLRTDFLEKFQKLIEDYNAGLLNTEAFFMALIKLAKELNEEEKRHMKEQLSEEELAVFDILTKPEPTLSKQERDRVKAVAKELLETLKKEKLVIDWRRKQQTRAQVRKTIEDLFDNKLPEIYDISLFRSKCDLVYQHIYDSYYSAHYSIYNKIA